MGAEEGGEAVPVGQGWRAGAVGQLREIGREIGREDERGRGVIDSWRERERER